MARQRNQNPYQSQQHTRWQYLAQRQVLRPSQNLPSLQQRTRLPLHLFRLTPLNANAFAT
jgi:hypothetical protein